MFVPNTKGGLLLKKLKEMEEILCNITGFRIKFTEAGGTPLSSLFSLYMSKGHNCGREPCVPCDRENKAGLPDKEPNL